MTSLNLKKPCLRLPRPYLDIVRKPENIAVNFPKNFFMGYYFYECTEERDYQQAYLWFLKGAQQKDSDCMLGLGEMYLNGDYVKNSDHTAFYWLYRAAELKNLDAIEFLFDLHFDKSSRFYNLQAAHNWATLGDDIDGGESPIFKLMQAKVWLERGDDQKALIFFLEADKLDGGWEAAYYLGLIYEKTYKDKAIDYFLKAARAGHLGATKRLRSYLKLERSSHG